MSTSVYKNYKPPTPLSKLRLFRRKVMKTSVVLGGGRVPRKAKLTPEQAKRTEEEIKAEKTVRDAHKAQCERVMKHLRETPSNAVFELYDLRERISRPIMVTSFLPHNPTGLRCVFLDTEAKDQFVLGLPMACPDLTPTTVERWNAKCKRLEAEAKAEEAAEAEAAEAEA